MHKQLNIECPRIFYLNSFNLYSSIGRIYCPKVFDQVTCWNYTLANATAVGGCPLSHPQGLIFSPQGRVWQSLKVEQFNLLRLHKMYVFYIPYMKNNVYCNIEQLGLGTSSKTYIALSPLIYIYESTDWIYFEWKNH